MPQFVVFNGDLIESSQFKVSLNDRAFLYGDGIFETIFYSEKGPRFFSDHLERIKDASTTLDIDITSFLDLPLFDVFKTLADKNKINKNGRLKINIWRKEGGLYTPNTNNFNFLIQITSLDSSTQHPKKHVGFYNDFHLTETPVSKFKNCNALPYILGGNFMKKNNFDDIIYSDFQGHVSECLYSNIFWVKEGKTFTPSLSSGCTAGIMRKNILSNTNTTEGLYKKEELLKADFVFCSNALGVYPIKKIENINLPNTNNEFTKILSQISRHSPL